MISQQVSAGVGLLVITWFKLWVVSLCVCCRSLGVWLLCFVLIHTYYLLIL